MSSKSTTTPAATPATTPAATPATTPAATPAEDATDALAAFLTSGPLCDRPAGRNGNVADPAIRRNAGFAYSTGIDAALSCHPGIGSLTDADIATAIRTRAANALAARRDADDVLSHVAGETAFALGYIGGNEPHLRGRTFAERVAAYKPSGKATTGRALKRFGETGPAVSTASIDDAVSAVRVAAYGWERVYRAC